MNSYDLTQRQINNERNKRIVNLRENGISIKEIARLYHISESRVNQIVQMSKTERRQYIPNEDAENIAYKGLREWMLVEGISIAELNRRMLVPYSYNHFYAMVCGRSKLCKEQIDELIRITGLSYEQLFKGE